MSDHIDDELPLVLTGEADRETVRIVVAHLRECADCVQELISLLVSHASLASAARFAPEVLAAASVALADPPPTPDLSAVFAQVRSEAEAEAHRPAHAAHLPQRRWQRGLLAAAAVVVIGGGATAVIVTQTGGGSTPSTQVALSAYDVGTNSAHAVVRGDQMKVDATSLPTPPAGELYEVWLTNDARTAMHPLGWVAANGTGSYTVPAPLMDHFSAIEVSVQKVAAPDGYSGTSVLRGEY
jgi:hypothetical protein